MRNVTTLRDALFDELQSFPKAPTEADMARIDAKVALADRIIDTMRIEVQLAAVMKGSMAVPFIEEGTEERPALPPPDGAGNVTQLDRVLHGGPSPDHPWRKSS